MLSKRDVANHHDIETIGAVLAGNTQAFEKIVRDYQSMVFTLALRMVGFREEAEEITQDVFVKVFRSLGSFQQKSNFSTWLYRITYNESVNYLRSHHKKIQAVEIGDDAVNLIADSFDSGEETEEKQIIKDCIMALPEIDRIIITLYYYDDVPVREVAEITGLTESNVKARLFRARQKLYDDMLEKQGKLNRLENGR